MLRSHARRLAGVLAAGAAVAGFAAGPAASAGPARPRIVGGAPASPGEYPFHAYVQIDRFQCGGSLVAARYVITAGHCTEAATGGAELAIGVTSVAGGLSSVPAANRFTGTLIRNPAYGNGGVVAGTAAPVNDVAVIRLDRLAPFAQLRLPRPQDAPLWVPGAPAVAIGFGTTESGRTSDQLLEVGLPIAADSECSSVYGPDYRPAGNVCAGFRQASGKDTCTGDSGGPLLAPDGFGGLVLAGVTSFGSEECGSTYGVYTEVGSPEINAFLRSVVPQAEITPSTGAPLTGDAVTYTAELRDPDGRGPFGGYDAVAWDLNGDDVFAEAVGSTTASAPAARGDNRVSVAASSGAGNAEVRTVHVVARDPTLVAFAAPAVTVREGAAAALALAKSGPGAGAIVATPAGGDDALGSGAPVTVGFAAGETHKMVSFATRADRTPEASRAFTVSLGGGTGDLRPGSPSTVTVTVRDDDARVRVAGSRSVRVRSRRFTLRVIPNRPGRLRATAAVGGRTIARAGARPVRSTARRSLALKLTTAGRSLLRRGRAVRARVSVVLTPSGGGLAATARRRVRLRP